MFEFSLASIVLVAIIGAVAWHFYATKILKYVSPAEAALHAKLAALEAKLLGAHDTLKAELTGLHDVSHARLANLEALVTPAASAGVTAAAIAPDKPAA